MNNKPFVNPFDLSSSLAEQLRSSSAPAELHAVDALTQDGRALAITCPHLLAGDEVVALNAELTRHPWQPVGLDGIADHFHEGDPVGSYRASCFSEPLAAVLWQRLDVLGRSVRVMDDLTPTDWDGHRHWRAVGVNPLMRFIRYEQQGRLVPHYDAPFDYGDGRRRTLVTLVIYLERTAGAVGGATRFIADPQTALPVNVRDYRDRARPAEDSEIALSVEPEPGRALLFDHRILHDSEPLTGTGRKTILRTDIVYERVGDGAV
jgi:hypothetical protein